MCQIPKRQQHMTKWSKWWLLGELSDYIRREAEDAAGLTDDQSRWVVLMSFISRRKISCLMNNAAHDRWLPAQGRLQSRLHAPKLIIKPIVLFFRTICKPWTPVLLREREKVIILQLFLLLRYTLHSIKLDKITRIIWGVTGGGLTK